MMYHGNHFIGTDFTLLLGVRLVELATLHDQVINLKLPGSTLDNFFFHRFFCDEPINNDFPFLADTVRPVDGLQVHLRIPIRIENDDDVGLMEVDANTAGPRREYEDLLLALGILEVINAEVALVRRRLPVDSTIPIASNPQHVVKNVHELRHLAEDEYLAVFADQLRDQVVEDFELHRGVDNVVSINERWAGLHILEQVRMIAYLLELHQNIQQLNSIFVIPIIDCRDVSGEDPLVELLLQLGQSNGKMDLLLLWQCMLFLNLEAPEHEGPEEAMDLRDDLLLFLLVIPLLIGELKQLLELIRRLKELRHEKVK